MIFIKRPVRKKIAIDLDNTLRILPEGKVYTKILKILPECFMGIFTLITGITNQRVRKILEELKKKKWSILILSSRMSFLRRYSIRWLDKNKIPYDKLICVGPLFRRVKKLRVLRERGVKILIDDDIVIKDKSVISIPPEKFIQLSRAVVPQ